MCMAQPGHAARSPAVVPSRQGDGHAALARTSPPAPQEGPLAVGFTVLFSFLKEISKERRHYVSTMKAGVNQG